MDSINNEIKRKDVKWEEIFIIKCLYERKKYFSSSII